MCVLVSAVVPCFFAVYCNFWSVHRDHMDHHAAIVKKCCRVCAGRLGQVSYDCSSYSSSLLDVFGLQDTPGNPAVDSTVQSQADQLQDISWLPQKFCQSCYCALQRAIKAKEEGRAYSCTITVATWPAHNENCPVCEGLSAPSRGRPKNVCHLDGLLA